MELHAALSLFLPRRSPAKLAEGIRLGGRRPIRQNRDIRMVVMISFNEVFESVDPVAQIVVLNGCSIDESVRILYFIFKPLDPANA
jgi:hypothetical protein